MSPAAGSGATPAEACGKVLANVRVLPSGCWEYLGKTGAGGYARIYYNGELRSASRAVASVYLGLDVDDRTVHVCHHCDYPPCVNPACLFLGSASDNCQDAIVKGRRPASPPNRPKAVCAKGHDMSQTRRRMSDGHTRCIVCQRERHAAGERRRRLERKARAAA